MPNDEMRISLSSQGEGLAVLAQEWDAVTEELMQLASRVGVLTQKQLLLHDAMQRTLVTMNGGAPLVRCPTGRFEALNHY